MDFVLIWVAIGGEKIILLFKMFLYHFLGIIGMIVFQKVCSLDSSGFKIVPLFLLFYNHL